MYYKIGNIYNGRYFRMKFIKKKYAFLYLKNFFKSVYYARYCCVSKIPNRNKPIISLSDFVSREMQSFVIDEFYDNGVVKSSLLKNSFYL